MRGYTASKSIIHILKRSKAWLLSSHVGFFFSGQKLYNKILSAHSSVQLMTAVLDHRGFNRRVSRRCRGRDLARGCRGKMQ